MSGSALTSIYFFTLFVICFSDGLSREKRALIWREGASRLQIITGLGVPITLNPENVIVGTVIKANYKLPMNASYLSHPYTTFERKKRAASRWDIYNLLEQAMEMRGVVGKACILRAICEMAQHPLNKKNGLFDELLHKIFSPTSTKEKLHHYSDNEYYFAQSVGQKSGKCGQVFQDCSVNLMDMFTVFNNR